MKAIKDLVIGGLVLFGLGGCEGRYLESAKTYKNGVVVSEKYIDSKLEEKVNVGLLENTTYMGVGDSKYILRVESNNKVYTLDMIDSYYAGSKESLDNALDIGDKIIFKYGRMKWNSIGGTIYFSDFVNRRGMLSTGQVEILD